MSKRTWTGALPRLYDLCMAPLERGAVGRWRARQWQGVDRAGLGLEVGAGTGASLGHLPSGVADRAVLSDLSPKLLRRARAGRARTTPAPAWVAADAMDLPFRDGTFDWVVATFVFCEVPDALRGLNEARRVLRAGGRLHLLEHVRPHGLTGRLADLATALTGPLMSEHWNRRTVETARRAGFRIESEEWLLRDAVVLLRAT